MYDTFLEGNKNENYFIKIYKSLNSIFKNYEGKLLPSYINLKVDVLVTCVQINIYYYYIIVVGLLRVVVIVC